MNNDIAANTQMTQRNESLEQTMEPIPNWFRWLIIVIATLIMCACRAPLQQTGTQSVLKRKSAGPVMHAEQSVLTTLTKLRDTYDLDGDFISTKGQPKPVSMSGEDEPGCHAPIIQLAGRSIRVQDVEKLKAASGSPIKAPVYFHVDDSVFAVRQTQALVPTPASPFLDDPVSPSTAPIAPVMDPSTQLAPIENPPHTNQHYSNAWQQNAVLAPEPSTQYGLQGTPIPGQSYPLPTFSAFPTTVQPIVTEGAVLPLAPTIIGSEVALPYPYDFLPYAEIPVECAPEEWAITPADSMGISYCELNQRYPDEYVCDGGDAMGEVNVLPDWTINNLDPEDTIGHYDTLDNKVEVAASNRVCIYAPRFAAVRKVTSPFENEKHEQVLIEKRDDMAVTQQQRIASVSYEKTVSAQRHVHLQPASSLQRDLPGVTGIHVLPVREIDHDLSVHEDFRVLKLGIHKQAEKAKLAEYTARAITWSGDMAVQVVVDEVVARASISDRSIEQIHTIGDNRPAKLRVIKTASVSDALPGEEVEFTLRFDNIGHQPMGNVTIIDNLTTRLEYLNDTELCSLKNDFVVDENDVESLTLRWEITDPILPGKGGVIRFKCRVR